MAKKIIPPKHASSAEREYLRRLRAYAVSYIGFMKMALKGSLPELKDVGAEEQPRLDANIENKIRKLIEMVDAQLAAKYPDEVLLRWSMSMIGQVNRHTKKQVNRMFKEQVEDRGDEPDFIGLMSDGKLHPFFKNVAEENIGLIRSIPKLEQEAFKNNLVYLLTQDMPAGQISEAIQKHFTVSKNRANLIAVDQVGKLQGKLEQYRQQQLGVEYYFWEDSGDSRVRHDHHLLAGKRYRWDKPPIVDKRTGRRGNPKSDYRCRCWARPDLKHAFGI